MNSNKIKETRRRLASEHENLIKSIKRSRLAAEEIKLEKTEDEGDLAMISHETAVIYNLHEGGFARLRSIQEAMKAIDRGRYGECVRCRNGINEKRLMAIPWATLCIRCQEETEAEQTSSRMVPAGLDGEETEF
jgi:RNA polymerase-binding transcription factor